MHTIDTQALFAPYTDEQVHTAFFNFLDGRTNARKRLGTMEASVLHKFMIQLMGKSVVQAFLDAAARLPGDNLDSGTNNPAKPQYAIMEAQETVSTSQCILDEIEVFMAVVIMHLEDKYGGGFEHILTQDYGGTGIFNHFVSFRSFGLRRKDYDEIRIFIQDMGTMFPEALDLSKTCFDREHAEDVSVEIPWNDNDGLMPPPLSEVWATVNSRAFY